MTVLRYLDLVLLAVALAVFAVADLPLLGWVVGAVIWGLWRAIDLWVARRLADEDDPKKVAGIATGSLIGRGWLLGLILLGSGLAAGREVGLSAGLLVLALFTVYFTAKIIAPTPARTPRTSIT